MEYKLLIDGNLVKGAAEAEVINPATGIAFATAPLADRAQLDQAVMAARSTFAEWKKTDHATRRAALLGLADAMERQFPEFARLMTLEQGKPLPESEFEIGGTIAGIRYFAEQRLDPEVVRETDFESIVRYRDPVGVVAAVSPWNFPMILQMLKIAPALITGNVVIAKPAPTTPLTSLLMAQCAAETLPAGVLQFLNMDNDLASALVSHPGIDHVSFTGSTATGRKIAAMASQSLASCTLELGGNDASIVLDDADLDIVAPAVYGAAMTNAGQICMAAKRVYAPRAMYDELCNRLGEIANAAIVGDGLEQGTQMGPIQNRAQFEKLKTLLDEARAEGAIVAGGTLPDGEGYFMRPTIVRDIPATSRLVQEEQFGPILPVLAYDDLEEAISAANDSEFGLAFTVWTSDSRRGMDVARQIETGTAWVNKFLDLPFDVPFGGIKQSGIGRNSGPEGLHEFTQIKVVNAAL